MIDADRQHFGELMLALSELPMPGRVYSDLTAEVYWRALKVLSREAFTQAAEAALRTAKWFPTPAELLELARTTDPATDAGLAFERTLRLHTHSPHAGALWSEAEIRETIGEAAAQAYRAAGGNAAMRHALHRDAHEPYTRKAFVECYLRVIQRDPATALPVPSAKRLAQQESRARALVAETAKRLSPPQPTFETRRQQALADLRKEGSS